MRIVLDTAVLVAALRSPKGASRKLLGAILRGEIAALVSVPLMLEYEAVSTREEHLSAAGVSASEVELILCTLADLIEPVALSYRWRPLSKDPSDDMVLETAINEGADLIVTHNLRDFTPVCLRFGLRAVLPGQAVELMEEQDAPNHEKE